MIETISAAIAARNLPFSAMGKTHESTRKYVLTHLLALLRAVSYSLAQENNATAQDGPAVTQQELDQLAFL